VSGLLLPYARGESRLSAAPSGWGGISRRVRKRRLLKKRGSGWMRWLLLTCLLLLPGCVTVATSVLGAGASVAGAFFDYKSAEKGEAVVVTPPLVEYSPTIMNQAAAELEFMRPPCARDIAVGECSALSRMIIDYGELREKIRAAK